MRLKHSSRLSSRTRDLKGGLLPALGLSPRTSSKLVEPCWSCHFANAAEIEFRVTGMGVGIHPYAVRARIMNSGIENLALIRESDKCIDFGGHRVHSREPSIKEPRQPERVLRFSPRRARRGLTLVRYRTTSFEPPSASARISCMSSRWHRATAMRVSETSNKPARFRRFFMYCRLETEFARHALHHGPDVLLSQMRIALHHGQGLMPEYGRDFGRGRPAHREVRGCRMP